MSIMISQASNTAPISFRLLHELFDGFFPIHREPGRTYWL
jgi:hypothetical protein